MLERKVSELSKVINGLAVQLAEVSSVVRDIKRPVAVQDDVELRIKKGEAKKGENKKRRVRPSTSLLKMITPYKKSESQRATLW